MGPRKSVWGVWRGCSRKREDWVGQAGWWVQPREICLAKARCLLAVEGLELCMDRGVGKSPPVSLVSYLITCNTSMECTWLPLA